MLLCSLVGYGAGYHLMSFLKVKSLFQQLLTKAELLLLFKNIQGYASIMLF